MVGGEGSKKENKEKSRRLGDEALSPDEACIVFRVFADWLSSVC
jgi:hypothetical protein